MNMRSHIIIVFVACAISVTGLWSCDSNKEPAKAKVVKKKIQAPAKTKARSKMAAKPKRPAMRPKSDVAMIVPNAKAAQATAPGKPIVKSSVAAASKATKPAAAAQPAIAQTSGPAAQGAGGTDKKPVAIAPKSDIAMDDTGGGKRSTPTANNLVTAEVKKPQNSPKPETRTKPVAPASKRSTGASTGATAKQASKGGKGSPAPYDPTGKINPFEPLFKEQPKVPAVAQKRIKRVPRTPLERISLTQLKLVGIILASSGNRALVQESSGKGYIIKKGTYIGLNSGKVTEIRKDAVVIEEEVENVLGKVTKSTKELKLPKPPGE